MNSSSYIVCGIVLLSLIFTLPMSLYAQHPSAIMDLESSEKGVLIPRMATSDREAIANPANSLMVYDTTSGSYWYYRSDRWVELAGFVSDTMQLDTATGENLTSYPILAFQNARSEIAIPDNGVITESTEIEVCINIAHTWVEDLDIYLISPTGTQIDLSSDNGGQGNNYTNTCFTTSAVTPITSGSAPFNGEYIPEQSFTNFIGEGSFGTWTLRVYDDVSADNGTLLNWSIEFSGLSPVAEFSGPLLVDGEFTIDGKLNVLVPNKAGMDRVASFVVETSDPKYNRLDIENATTNGSQFMPLIRGRNSTGRTGLFLIADVSTDAFNVNPAMIFDSRKQNPVGPLDSTELFVWQTNGQRRMTMEANGQLILGSTTTPATNFRLSVDGGVIADSFVVGSVGSWPDYVFDDTYQLKPLSEVKAHIEAYHHLPGIPGAEEIEKNGQNIGEINRLLLEKIEEMTLHMIRMEEEHRVLSDRVQMLESKEKEK